MKRVLVIVFFSYCTFLAVLIAASGITTAVQTKAMPAVLLFLPVPLYFLFRIAASIRAPKRSTLYQETGSGKTGIWGIAVVFVALVSIGLFSVSRSHNKQTTLPAEQPTPTREERPKPSPTLQTTIMITTKDNTTINIRKQPSQTADIIGKAKANQTFILVSQQDQWYQVKLENEDTGWIHQSLATIQETP